jgi:peptidase E
MEARKEADEETQRKAADLRTREKALEDKKKAITTQEKAAARMEKEAAQMKDAAEATKIAAQEAAAKEWAKVAAAQQALATEQAELQRENDQKQAKLQADAEKVNSEKRSLEAMIKAQHSWASSPPMIYLSSSDEPKNLPDLSHAIKAYLQGKVVDGGEVTIIELNDAKPEKDPFADQPIYQTVKQHVKDLGYSTDAACYRFFKWQDVTGTELNNLLDKLARPGTICIVVGGNTWKLSFAFGQMKGVRATISRQVLCGDLMYVSFSAGSVMAGLTVEINRDDIDEVTKAGGTRMKDGFKLVPYAIRPHNQDPASQAAGKEFERRLRDGQVKDDAGQVIANCPVLYLEDGEACLFVGVAAEPIRLPDKCAKDKIAKLRYFLKKGSLSSAALSLQEDILPQRRLVGRTIALCTTQPRTAGSA